MNTDLMMQHLQADLRVCLENPSAESFSSLVNTIGSLTQDRPATEEDSSLWWMSHMKTSVRLFLQHPTKGGFLSLVRMSKHYLELVSKGILKPRRSVVSLSIPLGDYWSRMLEDKMSQVIDSPTELKVKGLKDQLDEYCKMKGVEL